MLLWVELWVGAFSDFGSNLLEDMVGPWGLEPQTSTVSWASFWIQFRNVPSFRPCCSANCGGRNPLERYRAIHSARSFRLQ